MKIFVVDDSDVDRKLLVSSLQKAGFSNEILQAADGPAALEILKREHNDICLMFLDWQLPKIDGLEILKRIARDPQTTALPIVMLTSANSPEDEEIARLLNPNLKGFVVKPIEPQRVIEIARPHVK